MKMKNEEKKRKMKNRKFVVSSLFIFVRCYLKLLFLFYLILFYFFFIFFQKKKKRVPRLASLVFWRLVREDGGSNWAVSHKKRPEV